MGSFFSATIIFASIYIIENHALQSNTRLMNSNVDCYNDYAYEGNFEFLDHKGEAFWHVESDNVYFEYYFPALCWTGIAASNQYSKNKNNYCVDCYKQNQDVSHCLAQCVGDSMFVVTSKSDNDPELPWKILEFQTNNNGQNKFNQYQIPSKLHSVWGIKGRENASFHLEKVNVDGVEYVHGSWRRELNLNEENKWIQPINDFDDICWTTISSTQHNANARASELGYFINKDSVEIHCDVGEKKICNVNIAEKEDDIPNFGIEIADDVCEDKNLSLVILLDASMSVSDYFEASKLWISNLLENTAELFDHENDKLLSEYTNGNENTPICLRTALIMFDHDSQLIWNLNDFDGPYNHKEAKSIITQAIQQNQMKRLSGTHIKDVLEYTIDKVFPLMDASDSNIVLMLSDGRPSSCYLDIDQNPCQISPNQISKDFEDLNVKFLVVAVGNEEEKYESVTRIGSTFECLFQDVERMENYIIISSSYFDLDSITQSVEDVVQSQQSHTCGLTNYECNIALHPLQNNENNENNIDQDVYYDNDWNYASYRFIVGNNDDIWPYYATIKIHTQCNDDNVELHCKLMHYDPSTQTTTVIKEADQILSLSSRHIPQDYAYKFSFRGSSIDRDSGLTVLDGLEVGETYVIQFHIIDVDGKCNGLNKLAIINSINYYDLDKYLMDVESSIALVIDNDKYQHPKPSQINHPIVTLCIAERSESNQQTQPQPQSQSQSPTQSLTQPPTTTTITTAITTTDPRVTRDPTSKPTSWPTRDVYAEGDITDMNHCQPPKYFPSPLHWNKCDEESVEWKVDFKNWFYNVYEEQTYVLYEICVLGVAPYDSCKSMSKTSAAMSMVLFQIPCFCEVCLNEMTDSMKPENGYTTEVHQGWLWEYLLFPGECLDFEIVLDGYVSMQTGYYKVQGDNRWIEGLIQVPNPCQPAIGYPMDYHSDHSDHYESDHSNNDNDNDICYHDNPMYPDHDCSYVCDTYLDNEWRMDYISSFNQGGNTVFVYNAFVESDIDNFQCTKSQHNTSQTLSKIYLRLGCDCKYQSESFLESITMNMEPFGDIHKDYWSWTLDLADGDIQELKLVLAGENMEMSYSDMTLVGSDRRCTSSNMIKVPNPCKNICNFGEWKKWTSFGQCSKECGGGYKYKTRECVSICDGLTKSNNCYGENNHMSPCNTNQC